MHRDSTTVDMCPRKTAPQGLSFLLVIGVVVTGIALIESWQGWPYAPFPLGHALLALFIPIKYGGFEIKDAVPQLLGHLRWVLIVAMLALVFIISFVTCYSLFLKIFNVVGNPYWDLIAEYRLLSQLYVARYGWTTVLLVGYLLIGVWPMFGEEFFYRGFLFEGLQHYISFPIAALISSALFGFRHAFQLVYLWPTYPWGAAVAYFLWAFGLSLIWSWSYYRTQSIWPGVATHAANLLLAPVMFVILISS